MIHKIDQIKHNKIQTVVNSNKRNHKKNKLNNNLNHNKRRKQLHSDESTSSNASSSSSSSDVNGHLKQIAQRESGGDTKAVNPSTGAAGKYQFLQRTWDSVAPSEYQGKSPIEAPESVQDQAAQKLYDTEGASQWVTA